VQDWIDHLRRRRKRSSSSFAAKTKCLVSIGSALYSSSISLSAACSEERRDLVGSGVLDVTLRSMAMR